MTDRYLTLTVALEKPIRDDDAQATIDAIKQLRGVVAVTGNVADMTDWAAEQRVKQELMGKIWKLLRTDE